MIQEAGVKVKLIEKEIGYHERGLDYVLHHIEKEPDLQKLVALLLSRARGRSRVRIDAGETKDGGIYIQFWRPLKRGWRILAHYEIKPIEEVCHEQDRTCEGTEKEAGKEAAQTGVGENGDR